MRSFDTSSSTAPSSRFLVLSDKVRDQIRDRLLILLDEQARKIERLDEVHSDDSRRSAADLITTTEAIRAALAKLDSDAYGVCETCRGPIPLERLNAVPAARNCVACQLTAGRLIQ